MLTKEEVKEQLEKMLGRGPVVPRQVRAIFCEAGLPRTEQSEIRKELEMRYIDFGGEDYWFSIRWFLKQARNANHA